MVDKVLMGKFWCGPANIDYVMRVDVVFHNSIANALATSNNDYCSHLYHKLAVSGLPFNRFSTFRFIVVNRFMISII